jgi:hypothetical protein
MVLIFDAVRRVTLVIERQISTDWLAEHFRGYHFGRHFEGDTSARPLTSLDTV